jgi:DNA-binding NtrC family response regulator
MASPADILHTSPNIVTEVLEHAEMRELLTFNLEDGRIWMYDKRVTLQEVSVFGSLRAKLIETTGLQPTKRFLQRIGFQTGTRDAELLIGRWTADSEQARMTLHGFQGIVKVEILTMNWDPVDNRINSGEWIYHQCAEADAHIDAFGIGTEVACWMEVGYAMGYLSKLVGRPFIIKEIACRAMGSQHCRVVGHRLSSDSPEMAEFQNMFRDLPDDGPARTTTLGISELIPDAKSVGEVDKIIVGRSASLKAAIQLLESVAPTNATVLVTGESGVGKELFTRTLHRMSGRANKPFIAVNCAAIPESLIESELFGADRGAFTGAFQSRAGRFERADGGTLFLDEIGSLNFVAQAKLLRVLQEGEFERVGGSKSIKTDVRVIAATNISLRDAIAAGTFREDLFFRLNVFPIHLPPLRERRDDVPALLAHYLAHFNVRHNKKVPGFTFDALQALLNYRFPGNIRELENLVERAVILANDIAIDVAHLFTGGEVLASSLWTLDRAGKVVRRGATELPTDDITKSTAGISRTLLSNLAKSGSVHWPDIERSLFESVAKEAIDRAHGNISEAARTLGMERHQFAYRLKHLNDR